MKNNPLTKIKYDSNNHEYKSFGIVFDFQKIS